MAKSPRSAPSVERLVDETVALITEKGGSLGVNLREVARRAGFAHTNVYNYFPSFDHLLWQAFRRVLEHYGGHLARGLDGPLPLEEYRRRLITNLATYPQQYPGLYRFIGSDPLGPDYPDDILETVTVMKQWLFDAFGAATPGVDAATAADACDIVYAYLDGETFNLINDRTVPGEDVGGRMVGNALRLYELLAGTAGGGSEQIDGPPLPRLPLAGSD